MDAPVKDAPGAGAREAVIARAEALYRDLNFDGIRAWKTAHPGRKAIGFLPIYVPREVIHAAGALPVGVMGAGDLEIVKGDAYFQSYICRIPRSVIELGLNGALDCLDGMVFPSTCDVIRNLSGMWQILFPERYVRYLDLPQNFDMAVGGAFFKRELSEFMHDLAEVTGSPVTDESLRASLALYNANRRELDALYRLRVAEPWQVPTSDLYLLMRASNVMPVEEHTALLAEYRAACAAEPRRPLDMARVAVRGCFCEQPPLDLVRTLERSGCYIVDDDWVMAARWIQAEVPLAGDPLDNLVRSFLKDSPECPSMYLEEGEKGAGLVAAVRQSGAEGVLFAAPSFCDPALLDQPMTMAAVKAAGIPCTAFLYSESTGQFQVIREQAGTFADSIKLS